MKVCPDGGELINDLSLNSEGHGIDGRVMADAIELHLPVTQKISFRGSKQIRVTVYGRAQALPVSTSSGRSLYSP